MLGGFFNRPKSGASAPQGKKIYAIGDIHGRTDLLTRLLNLIADDAGGLDAAELIFLGDYVDRGPDSKGVVERLVSLQREKPETVFLKGNHEAVMLDFIRDPLDTLHWLEWGGEETLVSYDLRDDLDVPGGDFAAKCAEKIPPAHLDFLNTLSLYHIEGDYLFVHAGVRPGVALEDQREEDLLWIRERFHKAGRGERPPYTVVHGHHPVDKPLDAGWRIDVDTGACWTGKLTAVALEGDTRRFIST